MTTANKDLALSCSGICTSITAVICSSAPNDSIFLVKYAPQLSVSLVDDSSTKDIVSTGRQATSGSLMLNLLGLISITSVDFGFGWPLISLHKRKEINSCDLLPL